ncbi:conserved hypothetical protein [Leishmania infantum JPCM5]|uniref:Cytochrome_b5-like_Heme /Steroid_binding_domain_containing_protein_-_putative n=2 Tax=Leishmania infantum TaxID=5671 RepID=A0A6L0XG07_LEIIN|nr:conserved hypothetical protein [Leishmania infantum JPCM5]CAC9496832.1 Cytochrome_b5-like_Heme /Steroid_binding_domain_containing_protein_-_putative [Leishmania infantum]CAM68864.1 conserved hypothetical protein [Leishmania infantum JPCM5]SUZ42733.1 Cytochrome_b5-like_Heme /Steroid_binding_domain_containing_protein_-_putative [Leishmania infantum]|eukprot:XP_001470488.1 conserved hypothetical protein [Leishmania infantum JPCM5]
MEQRATQRATSARSDRYDGLLPLNPSPSIPSLVITTSTPTVVLPSSPSTVASALGTPLVETCPRSLAGSSTHTSFSGDPSLIASRSPSMQLSSTAASFAASSLPSNWVVHDPPTADKAPVSASLPAAAATVFASLLHHSSAESTPDSSPVLHPRPAALATMSAVALHDAVELEKTDASLLADLCGPGRQRTPRYVSTASITAPTATPEAGNAGAPCTDSDSSLPAALRRLFRRTSASKTLQSRDDGADAALTADDEHDATALLRAGAQSKLHPGRSHNSGGAGSPHGPSPVPSSTPAVALGTAPIAAVMPAFEEGPRPPLATPWSGATTAKGDSSDHMAAAASTPAPQPRCVATQKDFASTSSQRQESHISPRARSQAYLSVRSGAATMPGQSSLCSPVSPTPKRRVYLGGAGNVFAGKATKGVVVNYFSSAVELQSGRHNSNASSSVSPDLGNGMNDKELLVDGSAESRRPALSGAATALRAAPREAATSSNSASDTAAPPALSGTVDAAAPREASVGADASASCTGAQAIDVAGAARHSPLADARVSGDVGAKTSTTQTIAKTEERFPRSSGPPHLFNMVPSNLCSFPKAAITSTPQPSTFAHTSLATSSATSSTYKSRRQHVRASSQPVASSCLLFARSGATGVSAPMAVMQRSRTNEDVHGNSHGSHGRDQHKGWHRRAAHTDGGFSTLARSAHKHHHGLGCGASAHLSVSPHSSGCTSPEQDGAQGIRVHYTPSSVSSFPARTEPAVDDDDRGFSSGRSAAVSKFGSFLFSTNVTNTPRLSVDDSASRMSSPSTVSSINRNSFVDLADKSPQEHLPHNYLHSSKPASALVHNVPACARESPTSEADVMPITLVPPTSLRRSGPSEACLSGSVVSSDQRCSSSSGCDNSCGCMQMHNGDDEKGLAAPASATPPRGAASTFATSSVASLAATVTSIVGRPISALFSSGNLTAPMSRKGSNSTFQLSPPGASTGHSTPCFQDGFVMRPDAETLQGLLQGKVPRMPGCSIRDWAAHLSAKEEESRRREQKRHHTPHHRASGGATHFGGGASPPKPASTAASRNARLPRMTPQEVSTHNTPDDLWIVIRNVVYDCTAFQRYHPGGEKLLLACGGRDATAVYDRFHAWVSCESFMAPYAVGVVAPSETR